MPRCLLARVDSRMNPWRNTDDRIDRQPAQYDEIPIPCVFAHIDATLGFEHADIKQSASAAARHLQTHRCRESMTCESERLKPRARARGFFMGRVAPSGRRGARSRLHSRSTAVIGSADAAGLFLTSLMASGISSSVVGTMAGQMIMQDFLGISLPLWLRSLVTMAPSFIVVALGVEVTRALVLSQVVLSFTVPVPMLALIGFASSRGVMGEHRLGRPMRMLAVTTFIVVVAMNAMLLAQTWPFS